MALSTNARKRVIKAAANNTLGKEVADAIDTVTARVSAAVTDVSTADATDLASAVALANANKAKINALLAALRTAGLLSS